MAAERYRYTLVLPDGTSADRTSETDREITTQEGWDHVVSLIIHAFDDGARIENVRKVDRDGKDLPDQPKFLRTDHDVTIKGLVSRATPPETPAL